MAPGLWTSGWVTGIGGLGCADQVDPLVRPTFQFGHPAAFRLADKPRLMPGDLNYAFFTNSGSESADTRSRWRGPTGVTKGQPAKTRFIGRQRVTTV